VPKDSIDAATARQIALTALGFGTPRAIRSTGPEAILAVIKNLSLLQIDSVNVFCRSHYLPIYSRLGPYERSHLDELAAHAGDGSRRRLVEYSAHETSLIPVELYSLFRWRMARVDAEAWKPLVTLAHERPELLEETKQLVREQGPIRAAATGGSRTGETVGGLWNFRAGKSALEYLCFAGELCPAGRVQFERLYDLPERVLPAQIISTAPIAEADAQRELIRRAAHALGVATESDLADYFRMGRAPTRLRIAELVEAAELVPVQVEGWPTQAYTVPKPRTRLQAQTRALLSPFDPLVWFRERTKRLFDFDYKIEIYTPAAKRVYGYYVLPFLLADRLVARVDLKSDRKSRMLRVQAAFIEPGGEEEEVARELARELEQVSRWLGLASVQVAPRGDLASSLAAALA
jgi:uncharacterized protein YcaQ